MKVSLSDLLQSVRIAKIDTAFIEIAEGAGVRLTSNRNASVHLVLEGQVQLDDGAGTDKPVRLDAGDYAVWLEGKPQVLKTSPDVRLSSSSYFMTAHMHDAPPTIRFGSGRNAARLLSGAFHIPVLNPLVRALPRRMVMRKEEAEDCALLIPNPAILGRTAIGPGATTLLTSTIDMLFIQAVRTEVSALFSGGALQTGKVDQLRIPIALSLIHSHPERRWTLERLAAEVGVSRSTFAAEFTTTIGEPLMQYLTRLRMTHAADMLRWQPVAIADVAWNVGYESVASFSRAFRKYYGTTPAAYQKEQARRHVDAIAGHMHWTPFLSEDV